MVLTVSFALPGDRALLPPSPLGLIQINGGARLQQKVVHGIKTAFHNRTGRDCDYRSQRGCNRLHWIFHLGGAMKARVRRVSATLPRARVYTHRLPGSST